MKIILTKADFYLSKLSNFYNGENTSLRKEDGMSMRIGPKTVHITPGLETGKPKQLGISFEDRARFDEPKARPQARPLAGRVTKPRNVTTRGDELSKRVGKIVKGIPSPFLTKRSSSTGS